MKCNLSETIIEVARHLKCSTMLVGDLSNVPNLYVHGVLNGANDRIKLLGKAVDHIVSGLGLTDKGAIYFCLTRPTGKIDGCDIIYSVSSAIGSMANCDIRFLKEIIGLAAAEYTDKILEKYEGPSN